MWGLFFKTAPFPSQVKYFSQHPLANFKVKKLIQKHINLRQEDHHSASFCALNPKNALPRSISKKCILVFPRKSPTPDADFRGNTKMHLFEIDLGTAFFGSSAQNDAEWWSYCRKLICFCMSFLTLKLASGCWKKYFTCDGKGAVLKKSPHMAFHSRIHYCMDKTLLGAPPWLLCTSRGHKRLINR